MRPTYNSLLLERLFFPSLNFSHSFFYFPFPSFVPYFFFFFLICSLLFLFISFIINGLYISLLHTQYTFLYIFLLQCSNFIKIYARRCAQIMTYFFLLVDINLNHNVILYFFTSLLHC